MMPGNVTIPGLDFGLGEEIDMLRDSVRGFADARVAPIAAEIDRTDEFPRHLWPEMGRLGLHGITVAEEWGGANMGYLAHCVAMEEVSRASASVGLSYGAHSNLCVNQISRNGTEEQKRRYLPALARGEELAADAAPQHAAEKLARDGDGVVEIEIARKLHCDGSARFVARRSS